MSNKINFDEMYEGASTIVDEDLQIPSEKNEQSNPYKLDEKILKLGHKYDSNGVYFHFNETYQTIGVENESNFTTKNNIYLWITRNFDTRKKIELNCRWAIKQSDNTFKFKGNFSLDHTLDVCDEKILKNLNKSIAFSGKKVGNPSSEGSYVKFVEDILSLIMESDNLDVFKETNFELPEVNEEETFENTDDTIQSFEEYPEDVQHEALKLINEGRLFEEAQKSVSLTHEGDYTSRDALILMEASLFISGKSPNITSVHGLIGGDSGKGKSDLAIAVSLNFPKKYVYNLRNVSPKYLFYAIESFNDEYNILFVDDANLTQDLIEIYKGIADNTTKKKELLSVKDQNPIRKSFEKAKFVVILTYAKTIPDNEFANRLFNLGVIVDEDNEKSVKEKIRDNNVIGGNDNPIIERNRLIIQASIHYLIEQEITVFNPFLSIFNPEDYIPRDVNNVSNLIKTKTFFEYKQRKQIQLNDDLAITIGDFEEFKFVRDMWSEDVDAQKYKLSERQKQILNILPEMTRDEAYAHIEELNKNLQNTQSRKARDKILDNEFTKKAIAKKLQCNLNTLVNDLDRSNQGTSKSLYELGLIDKIQIDEDIKNSPNIYYKIKNEGEPSESDKSIMYNMYSQFTQLINYSITKQKIIIDLLYYVQIIINERGYIYLKNYCDKYDEDINVESYDSIVDFIQGFFDGFQYDKYSINIENSSLEDLGQMSNFKQEITNEFSEKNKIYMCSTNNDFLHSSGKTKENAPITNSDENNICKIELHSEHNNDLAIGESFGEIGVDFTLAHKIFDVLSSGEKNLDEIRNVIVDGENPDDVLMDTLPMKIEMTLKRLVENDYLHIIEPINQAKKYQIAPKLNSIFKGDDV